MTAYIGVAGKARQQKKIYVGVAGKAREVSKGCIGVLSKGRLFYTSTGNVQYIPIANTIGAGNTTMVLGSALTNTHNPTTIVFSSVSPLANVTNYHYVYLYNPAFYSLNGTDLAHSTEISFYNADKELVQKIKCPIINIYGPYYEVYKYYEKPNLITSPKTVVTYEPGARKSCIIGNSNIGFINLTSGINGHLNYLYYIDVDIPVVKAVGQNYFGYYTLIDVEFASSFDVAPLTPAGVFGNTSTDGSSIFERMRTIFKEGYVPIIDCNLAVAHFYGDRSIYPQQIPVGQEHIYIVHKPPFALQ